MRKTGWRLLLATAIVSWAAAMPAVAQIYKTEYKMSLVPDTATPWGRGAELWANLVRERTHGRVNIKLYTAAALVGGDQTREFMALRQGVIDMAVGSTINWSPQIPDFNLFSLPFLVPDCNALESVTQGEVGRELFRRVEEQGVVPLAWGENGFRQLSNSRRQIRKPEDLQGLRIRVVGSLLFNDIFTALGAYPSQMNWNEATVALKTYTVDGQENPVAIYANSKLYTLGQRYVTLWNYVADPLVFVVNRQVWDGWTPRDRDIVRRAAIDAAKFETTLSRENLLEPDRALWKDMAKRGVKVTRLTPQERQRFVDATRRVYVKWKALIGRDLVDKAESAVAARQTARK